MANKLCTPAPVLCICAATFPLYASTTSRPVLSLQCTIDAPGETAQIRSKARDVVYRPSKHELRVRVGGKVLSFRDRLPYDAPLEGTRYYFCDRVGGYTLLKKEHEDEFSGVLINESTSQVSAAGYKVLFSYDRRAYFSELQQNGMDGELWRIYTEGGKLSWAGTSFVLDENRSAAILLSRPHWASDGEFKAYASCAATPFYHSVSTLKKLDGHWTWHPLPNCGLH